MRSELPAVLAQTYTRSDLPSLAWAHMKLALAALVVAAVVSLPPAVWLGHVKRGAFLAVSIVNIGRAVPSYAVIALLLPFSLRWGFGLGFWPTLVALVLLAAPPIFTNTYAGVRDAPTDAVEAARGMGMRPAELLRRVEIPVAMPLILAGLRISAVQVVATATLGAIVGYECLGSPIIIGLTTTERGIMVAAAATVAALALLTDGVFALGQRWLVPWSAQAQDRRRRGRPQPEVEAEAAKTMYPEFT
jgi:osmoprotectant transport system permease protein